jgi:4'-phosphopantetheinyl transferase
MPIAKIVRTSSEGILGIWKMTENCAEMEAVYAFLPAEHEDYLAITLEKRREEWLALRLCLRALLTEMGLPLVRVCKTPENKPYPESQSFELSFSHCEGFAAVYLHLTMETGIDMEKKGRGVERLVSKFLSEKELQQFDSPDRWLQAWCAKECLYKIYARKGLDFRLHLHLEPDHEGFTGKIQAADRDSSHLLRLLRYEDCYIVYNLT